MFKALISVFFESFYVIFTYFCLICEDVGLVEIVTYPDFSSSHQVMAFISDFSCLLSILNVSHAIACYGEIRTDVNVSIGSSITEQYPRTEVKNVNSKSFIGQAIGD